MSSANPFIKGYTNSAIDYVQQVIDGFVNSANQAIDASGRPTLKAGVSFAKQVGEAASNLLNLAKNADGSSKKAADFLAAKSAQLQDVIKNYELNPSNEAMKKLMPAIAPILEVGKSFAADKVAATYSQMADAISTAGPEWEKAMGVTANTLKEKSQLLEEEAERLEKEGNANLDSMKEKLAKEGQDAVKLAKDVASGQVKL